MCFHSNSNLRQYPIMPQVKGQTTGLMGSAGWVLAADLLQMHFPYAQNSCQPCGTTRRFPANVAADGARPQETILNLATRCRNAATSCDFNKGSSLASRSSPWRLQRSDMSSAAEVNTRGRGVEKVCIFTGNWQEATRTTYLSTFLLRLT